MKTLYLDCFSGISGDMVLGALIDLGVKEETLINGLEKLNIGDYKIEITKKFKNSIQATDVNVIIEEQHSHDHSHDYGHHREAKHHHRTYKDIKEIIDQSTLDDKVKKISKNIFSKIAKAEAKIHGRTMDEVHFHEVGAVDSIVDIVGAAICFCDLQVDKVVSTPLHTGTGTVKCQHGIIPVPAPATLEILKDSKIPFYSKGITEELVTPTGAAIVATLADEFANVEEGILLNIGYGAGKKDMNITNVLRMMIIESKKKTILDEVWVIETNIDDMTGEIAGYAMEKLLRQGALDVFYTPIHMKKNRPAITLTVLCKDADLSTIQKTILKETSTIGFRMYKVDRVYMDRELHKISTPYGEATVKVSTYDDIVKYSPEYEDCKMLADKNNVSIIDVYHHIIKGAEDNLFRVK